MPLYDDRDKTDILMSMSESLVLTFAGILVIVFADVPNAAGSTGLLARKLGEEGAVLTARIFGIGLTALGGSWFVMSFRKLLALRPRKPRLTMRDPFDRS